MDLRHFVCLLLTHRWKQVHEDRETVYLLCRRCGKTEPLADRPMGGYLGGV